MYVGITACTYNTGHNESEHIRKPKSQVEPVEIKVGERTEVARMFGAPYITYNGMNTDKTFSISSDNRDAVNIYYPITIKKIEYEENEYEVISVTPEKLKIKLIE
jgi:hypothetical protein